MTTAELELTTTGPQTLRTSTAMKALVYHGLGKRAWEDVRRPTIQDASDAIVRITTSTICGTDLHILKGDLPSVTDGRILGHEGIGIVEQVGTGVSEFHVGEKVIISCITACLKCDFCRRGIYSHCRHGGWILGNTIDGTQAEYVRIPHADGSLYSFPPGGDEEALVMLSDILPTGFECGVLNGQVKPGDTVAIVGAGPVGLAVVLTAQFYSPAAIFMIDLDDKRLAVAKQFGATAVINSADGHAAHHVMELTEGAGVDVAIEAVGIPTSFDICQAIVAAGGRIANVGVHGKPVQLQMEKLWDRNISLTTRLVDTITTPMLLKIVRSGKLQPDKLVTHRFAMNDIMKAYDTFGNAAEEGALKVVLHDLSLRPDELPKPAVRPYPSQYVSQFTMKDGTEVTLRPIRPEDEPLMVKFHETLSDRSVYMRYFSSLSLSSRVSHERLVRICFVDYDRVMALVVDHKDAATGQHRIMGVGRLIKLHAKNEAEVAILVSDQWQKQGLGIELLRRTVQIARDEKLCSVSAEMLRDNFAVQNIFKKVGFRLRLLSDPSSISAVLDLGIL
jgi:alcohol dehydrogenase